MPHFHVRLRALRPCDQLLVAVLCGNVFYILYYISMSSTFVGSEFSILTTGSTKENATRAAVIVRGAVEDIVLPEPTLENQCPSVPPALLGPLACDCDPVDPQYLISHFQTMELGGRLRPKECQPKQRTAIIIPYRNRYDHLHSLLKMLIPFLTRQQADTTFFVIDQVEPALFNRAALHNIGFLEALKIAHFDCFIFHDVDLVPLNDHHLYRCSDNPQLFAVAIKFGHWMSTTVMPEGYMGGVIGFTRQQYQFINGNSNLYFGWGGEDDDLYQRIVNKNLTRGRPKTDVANYQMLFHERQEIMQDRPERSAILKTSRQRQNIEGLNTSKYKVEDIKFEHLYTWIKVSLDMTEVFKTAPIYTLQDIRKVLS